MVELDDSKWSELHDAYGPAVRIPELLKLLSNKAVLRTKASDEPWSTLWSSLCHQGTVYTASYAAVPHIAQIAVENKNESWLNMNVFLLPSSIEIARAHHTGPEIPKQMEAEYFTALNELGSCAARYDASEDVYLARSAHAAILVADGRIAEAEELLESE